VVVERAPGDGQQKLFGPPAKTGTLGGQKCCFLHQNG
jgi:hypothetical protein